MRVCPNCGGSTTHRVQINEETPILTCSNCFEEAERGFLKYKALFEWYLEQGFPRDEANVRVILAMRQDPVKTKLPRYWA